MISLNLIIERKKYWKKVSFTTDVHVELLSIKLLCVHSSAKCSHAVSFFLSLSPSLSRLVFPEWWRIVLYFIYFKVKYVYHYVYRYNTNSKSWWCTVWQVWKWQSSHLNLKRICQEECEQPLKSRSAKLITLYPERLKAVISAKGASTILSWGSEYVRNVKFLGLFVCLFLIHCKAITNQGLLCHYSHNYLE